MVKDDYSVLQIKRFLGLNQNPDGDNLLKVGELAEMRNFRITLDGHLQIRPGTRAVLALPEQTIPTGKEAPQGVWRGFAAGREVTVLAWGGKLWELSITNSQGGWTGTGRQVGSVAYGAVTMFGFGGKVYCLDGASYQSWDGQTHTAFQTVDGYVPLVQTATSPAGAGTLLEPVNRLNGLRRVAFSPDGAAVVFTLPEKGIDQVALVTVNGETVTGYTADTANGMVIFPSAPAAGVNTVEITYRKGQGERAVVTGMRYCELYNGTTDSRVFLYGDGTNRTIYSGIRYDTGQGSAEYYPDLYELRVGDENSPLTGLVRHYSRLMAFKPASAWVIQYGTLDLEDGSYTAAFTVQPVNRQFGSDTPGQVCLTENNPVTLDAGGVYEWSSSGYSTYITANETNARRIDRRVQTSLRRLDPAAVRVVNLKLSQELWFLGSDGGALIFNYRNDTWYQYRDLPFSLAWEQDGEVFGACGDGKVVRFSRDYRSDLGEEIDCYAATGSMDMDREWLTKYTPMMFVSLQPESGARIHVTTETNRRGDYPDKVVAFSLATFAHVDFNHFSFGTNRKPQTRRLRMRVRRAAFYKLIFWSRSALATATVLGADIKLRFGGQVR